MIDLSKLEVPENPATGNDILIDSDILLGSDEKLGCSMLYLILNLMLGMGQEEPWVLF